MQIATYHIGGFIPAAPAKNKSEEYDNTAGTFTRWDIAGVQIEQRPLTTQEAARLAAIEMDKQAKTNEQTVLDKAFQALANNAAFLAISSPSAAQNAAQAKALTRQVNALIRLQLRDLADVSDT